MVRIIDKIIEQRKEFERNRAKHDDQDNNNSNPPPGWFYSFEFFPPKTEAGMDNLITRIDRMTRRLEPIFIDITFAPSAASRSLAVASHVQKYVGVDVLLHLSAQGMSRDNLVQVLEQAKASGIHNILVVRGDPPRGKRSWKVGDVSGGFCDRAIDLVKFVRELHGNYFGIAVAGHPEGHTSSPSQEDELDHLKEKLDAGADFIITQFFYDVDKFLDYIKKCRQRGITCPILPGIMPIQSYNMFKKMTEYCQVSVPDKLWERLEKVKVNDEEVKEIGCEVAAEMCRRILSEDNGVDGIHFYTLNLERSATQILIDLGAVELIQSGKSTLVRTNAGRLLPWRQSTMEGRHDKETVRPINWMNRPTAYLKRTETWDEFPNGRWGDSTSPAFGELSDLSHFYSFSIGSEEDQRAMLGYNPTNAQDIYEVFARYVEGKIPYLPWCETPLQAESFLIQSQLARLNRAGFLTINSQPAVNAAHSTDKSFGWGGRNGYVYQKAYCEFFCSHEKIASLAQIVKDHETMQLYAVNNGGEEIREGVERVGVTALTWGVFPNKEILQPTIFDPNVFSIWSEEAFSLWTSMWSNLYDFDSESFELIENIRDSYYLVAIIDNDYINGAENEGKGSAIWNAILSTTN